MEATKLRKLRRFTSGGRDDGESKRQKLNEFPNPAEGGTSRSAAGGVTMAAEAAVSRNQSASASSGSAVPCSGIRGSGAVGTYAPRWRMRLPPAGFSVYPVVH